MKAKGRKKIKIEKWGIPAQPPPPQNKNKNKNKINKKSDSSKKLNEYISAHSNC
jgi:hypothetical protein